MARRLAVAFFAAGILSSAALAAPGDRERHAINAADQAWAKRVNLTLRDLPSGFRQGPATASSPTGLTCPGFAPDLSRFTITGEALSRPFAHRSGISVFSGAEIFRSAADERADWALTARRAALPCLRQQLAAAVGPSAKVTTTMLHAPAIGERSIWLRATVSVTASGHRVTIRLDVLGTAGGRGDATLGVIAVGKAPSPTLERSLLAKLASRLAR